MSTHRNIALFDAWCPKCQTDGELTAFYNGESQCWTISCPRCREVLKSGLFSADPDNVPPWGVVLISEEPLTEGELARAREIAEELGLEERAEALLAGKEQTDETG